MSVPTDDELHALIERASPGCVRVLEPSQSIAATRFTLCAEPDGADNLGALLGTLDRLRIPVAIAGAGTKAWLGNALRGARVVVSTLRLSGIDELDAADGVVRVGAGTSLAVLAEKAEAAGWLLPLDAPGPDGTVGGALATALTGPRRLAFGPVRDSVLGLDTVLADGSVTRCGARVVKNVTGYDLAKLYVGSLGTLGVIERAWLRLRPLPQCTRVLHASLDDLAVAFAVALACARRPTARAVALLSNTLGADSPLLGEGPGRRGSFRLVVELASDTPAIDRDASWISAQVAVDEGSPRAIEGLRMLQTFVGRIGIRARVHALPSRLEACGTSLVAAGARVMINPVPGVITAWFDADRGDDEDPWWLDRVHGVLDAARTSSRGEVIIEAQPAWATGRRDVFGGAPGLSLMRTLKGRFDPNGILNPGRFVGAI